MPSQHDVDENPHRFCIHSIRDNNIYLIADSKMLHFMTKKWAPGALKKENRRPMLFLTGILISLYEKLMFNWSYSS